MITDRGRRSNLGSYVKAAIIESIIVDLLRYKISVA